MTIDEAVERFLRDLEVGRAPATVATYRSVLRRFAEFLDGSTPRPAALDELTAEHPVGFARWVSDGGRAPRTTVQLYTTAVTRLYAYLVREDLRPDLPLPKIQLRLQQLRGKRPKRLPRVPTDDLMERVRCRTRSRRPCGRRPRSCRGSPCGAR